jgi:hypothetical protein
MCSVNYFFLKRSCLLIVLSFAFCHAGAQEILKPRPEKRFGHYTEIGALATTQTTPDNVTTAAFSFQMVNGYRFNRWVFTGIGVGADLFATETIVPVFASLRGDLLKNKDFVPFYFADLGYGINLTSNKDISYKGGLALAAGIGFKINLINDKGFLVSFGYRFQQASFLQNNIQSVRDYNRLALRAGFYL